MLLFEVSEFISKNLKRFNTFLCSLLFVFIALDAIKGYSPILAKLRYVKDILLLLIFCELMVYNWVNRCECTFSWYVLFFICTVIIGGIIALMNKPVELGSLLRVLFKYGEFCAIYIVGLNHKILVGEKYLKKVVKVFIVASTIILFLNIIGCYVPNPILSKGIRTPVNYNFPGYENRLSLGQPAFVVFPCIIAMWLIISNEGKSIAELMALFINGCCIMLSTGITSIVAVAIGVGLSIVILLYKKRYSVLVRYLVVMFLVLVVVSLLWFTVLRNENPFEFAKERIEAMILGRNDDPAMEIRGKQIEVSLQSLENKEEAENNSASNLSKVIHCIFGFGMRSYAIYFDSIENTYARQYIEFGILGVVAFILLLVVPLMRSVKKLFATKELYSFDFLVILLISTIGLYSYTLDIFYASSTSFILGSLLGVSDLRRARR